MQENIHVINPNDQRDIFEEVNITETAYAKPEKLGSDPVTVNPDSQDACCKIRVTQDSQNLRTSYFVKTGVRGSVLDPWSQLGDYDQRRYAQIAGKNMWDYSRVTEKCFNHYMAYLKTQNKAHRLNAEREFING